MSSTGRALAPGNFRADAAVRSGSRSLHGDESSDAQNIAQRLANMPQAAAAFVTRGDRILAVSRGSDASNLNMPGGAVELGEDVATAAARELWEETGLRALELFPVFVRKNNGYLVTTYKVTAYSGELRPSEEGVPSWERPETLLMSSYGDYFSDMMEMLHGIDLPESKKKTDL